VQFPTNPSATGPPADAAPDPGHAHRRALEHGDEVVQQLAVAKYALTVGDAVRAMAAVDAALSTSRRTLTDLLDLLSPPQPTSYAGALLRSRPAEPDDYPWPAGPTPGQRPASD
jgi:hypothetical protein